MGSELREGWKYGTLEDAVTKGSSNISLNKVQEDDGDYPLFGAKGFAKNISFFHQEKEYLAIIKDGAGIGRISQHPKQSSILGTMQYLIPNNGFNIDFVKYFLYSIDFEKHRNGSTIPHIYFKDYKSEPFPILELQQQKQIVATLDKVFSAIDITKKDAELNLQNTKELFESYLQSVFENRDEGWEEKKLGEIATFRNGMTFSKNTNGTKTQILGVKNFKDSFFAPAENLEYVFIDRKLNDIDFLSSGDILAVRSNGNPKLIGRTILIDKNLEKTIHSGFTIRIKLNSKIILPIYLCHYLKTKKTRERLVKSGNGVGIKSLNQGSLSSLLIPFPPFQTQQKIVKKLNTLQERTKKLESIYTQKLKNLDELKKSMLQKAFNGELI
ncbi:MAG: restriction endonuclease subunit S [Sulfurimonas sp.]|nr:restriction endonuclease subunit S [Sulfurimonas sp.]